MSCPTSLKVPQLAVIFSFLACLLTFLPTAQASPALYKFSQGEVSLVSSRGEILPGHDLAIGIYFDLKPGWSLPWGADSGSGLPLEIAWELPDGFIASELQYPAPQPISQPTHGVEYGFTGTPLFVSRIATGPVIPPQPLAAEITWSVCREICVKDSARLILDFRDREAARAAFKPALLLQFQRRAPREVISSIKSIEREESNVTYTIVNPLKPKPLATLHALSVDGGFDISVVNEVDQLKLAARSTSEVGRRDETISLLLSQRDHSGNFETVRLTLPAGQNVVREHAAKDRPTVAWAYGLTLLAVCAFAVSNRSRAALSRTSGRTSIGASVMVFSVAGLAGLPTDTVAVLGLAAFILLFGRYWLCQDSGQGAASF